MPARSAPALLLLVCAAHVTAARGEQGALPAPAPKPGPADAPSFMRSIAAARREGPVVIDGRLDEAAWGAAQWGDHFTQVEPDEAEPASVATRFKVLWDHENIYVGVECDDPEPLEARLSRRDRFIEADFVSWDFDTTLDRRTAYHFQVYAAGQQVDGLHFNDTDMTTDWDGAWESKVARTKTGWSFEARIPLRLLRIPEGATAFGFNLYRHLSRRHEEGQWRYRPRGTPGDISALGLLTGLGGIQPVRALELRPYLAGRTTITTPPPSSLHAPLELASGCAAVGTSGSTVSAACVGLDLRYNLASDLTVVATLNPDFGQVEADARVLNLSTYETFFPEKRPFFLEGLDLFQSPLRNGFGDPYGGNTYQLFYSRRIGKPPAAPDTTDGAIVLYEPAAQPVAGALKLTGTAFGTSVGVLTAIEPKVFAQLLDAGGATQSDRLVADAGVQSALRLRRPVGDNVIAGFTGTASDPLFSGSARRAHVGSFDLSAFDSSRDYQFTTLLSGSLLSNGPREVVRDGTLLGPGASGAAVSTRIAKAGGVLNFALVGDWLSPQFNVNELGFQRRANLARGLAFVGYNDLHPNPFYQRWSANVSMREAHDSRFNVLLHRSFAPEFYMLFANYWQVDIFGIYELGAADDRELEDGTPLEKQPAFGGGIYLNTDARKPVDLGLTVTHRRERGQAAHNTEVDFTLGFRPHPQFEGTLEGAIIGESGTLRMIRPATAVPGGGEDPTALLDPVAALGREREYLLAPLHTQSMSLTLRGTFAFSPTLTLQSYAQLFTAGVAYGAPSRAILEAGKRTVTRADLSAAGAMDEPPDNDDRQAGLNLNLILRWEWRLGSTLYLVYAHQTANEVTPPHGLSLSGDLGALSRGQGAVSGDTILLKVDLLGAL